jgi:hypothetical protein
MLQRIPAAGPGEAPRSTGAEIRRVEAVQRAEPVSGDAGALPARQRVDEVSISREAEDRLRRERAASDRRAEEERAAAEERLLGDGQTLGRPDLTQLLASFDGDPATPAERPHVPLEPPPSLPDPLFG